MLSSELLSGLTAAPIPSTEIESVTDDSRRADAKSIFVCICGARFDGHALATDAYQKGCRFFVAQKPLPLPEDACVVCVENTRIALATLACIFYGNPSCSLFVIGITGTKGKTTTACLIRGILEQCNIPCGYIGTNGILYGDVKKSTLNTTPDPMTLQKTLYDMKQAGMRAVAIEVSSQALLQSRVHGIRFHATAFTNFSKDHIGPNEHPTLADYFSCKHRLFTDFEAEYSIWNVDDPATARMRVGARAKNSITYSAIGATADFSAFSPTPQVRDTGLGISFSLGCNGTAAQAFLPLIGKCNVSNALCALAIAKDVFSIPLPRALHALEHTVVDGRSECYPLPCGAVAVIDYAHNKESLTQILTALREYHPRRLLCLFGSVGERTQLRRRDLAEVASAYADACIITSDNPGHESPEAIVEEIASHLSPGVPFQKIADRKKAILTALEQAQSGDILLLAGKGHEGYQLIGDLQIPFSEQEILKEFTSLVTK